MPIAPSPLIDDRASGNLNASLGTRWQFIADTVMGGVSRGGLTTEVIDGRPCLRLTGQVSLAHNGGFVQAGLDLGPAGLVDARGWSGIELVVRGNDETYNLHLRTADTRIVWQSYRASFRAEPNWETVRLPFERFQPYRIDGLDHKSAQGRPAHVGLRAQDHVLQGSGDAGTEQGGRNYDQGRIDCPLDLAVLRRLGLVAIGREMTADLCLARIAFY